MIIGVDPGKMTGVWIIREDGYTAGCERLAIAALDFIFTADAIATWGIDLPTIYAVERYDIGALTTRMTRQYDALEVIGAVKWLAHTRPEITRVVMQPRGAKSRVSNDALRRLGWWQPGSAGHMHDAQRHALVCAATLGGQHWDGLVRKAIGTI